MIVVNREPTYSGRSLEVTFTTKGSGFIDCAKINQEAGESEEAFKARAMKQALQDAQEVSETRRSGGEVQVRFRESATGRDLGWG